MDAIILITKEAVTLKNCREEYTGWLEGRARD